MINILRSTEYLWKKLIQQLPIACVVCGQESENYYSICNDCEFTLPKMKDYCCRCGIELSGMLAIESVCGRCLRRPPHFEFCRATFPYTSPINKLVTSFKFNARFDVGCSLSRIMANRMNQYYKNSVKPQKIIPVPIHPERLRSRGFNQALEICKVVSQYCEIPIQDSVLIKVKNTLPQSLMTSAAARRLNLRTAFSVQHQERLETVTHIALVDDVVTTMATTEALCKLLQGIGVSRIDVWCLARANP